MGSEDGCDAHLRVIAALTDDLPVALTRASCDHSALLQHILLAHGKVPMSITQGGKESL